MGKKIIDLVVGQINDHHQGNTILLSSSLQVPLSPSPTLDGLIEHTRRPICTFSLNRYVCLGTLEKPGHPAGVAR